jgi:hypothetical protein
MTWIFAAIGLWFAYAFCRGAWRAHETKKFIHNALKPGAGLEMEPLRSPKRQHAWTLIWIGVALAIGATILWAISDKSWPGAAWLSGYIFLLAFLRELPASWREFATKPLNLRGRRQA